MHVEMVSYRKAPAFLRINWKHHCQTVLGRPFSDNDLIPMVSSPETWTCDYCREWRVKVYDGIAKRDHSRGVGTVYVHSRVQSATIEF